MRLKCFWYKWLRQFRESITFAPSVNWTAALVEFSARQIDQPTNSLGNWRLNCCCFSIDLLRAIFAVIIATFSIFHVYNVHGLNFFYVQVTCNILTYLCGMCTSTEQCSIRDLINRKHANLVMALKRQNWRRLKQHHPSKIAMDRRNFVWVQRNVELVLCTAKWWSNRKRKCWCFDRKH